MGLLIDGKWHTDWYDTKKTGGKFKRQDSIFRNWVTKDGRAGITGKAGFKAEENRYHLYVSLACPWAHRTIIFRQLKGLENIISLSSVNAYMGENGWSFELGDGVIADTINHVKYLHQLYTKAAPDYTGRVTVPILWDKKLETIVSNESSEIIRMFNAAFDDVGGNENNFYPEPLQSEIDKINKFVYQSINNGVYKAGFATSQDAYNSSVVELFSALDKIEVLLGDKRYLTGNEITEADWRLFTTLIRFDTVYVGHFKCNLKRIADYPNLWGYILDLYQQEGIAETVNIDHIKAHYYGSHCTINPTGIISKGPIIDFSQPHGREKFFNH